MIVAVGVDVVPVARMQGLLARAGDRTYTRLCTAAEADYCRRRANPAESLAARFAAKEAVMKCLRTGWAQGIGFAQIEVVRDQHGAVTVQLHGPAAACAAQRGIRTLHLSLSHAGGMATAFVVAEA